MIIHATTSENQALLDRILGKHYPASVTSTVAFYDINSQYLLSEVNANSGMVNQMVVIAWKIVEEVLNGTFNY